MKLARFVGHTDNWTVLNDVVRQYAEHALRTLLAELEAENCIVEYYLASSYQRFVWVVYAPDKKSHVLLLDEPTGPEDSAARRLQHMVFDTPTLPAMDELLAAHYAMVGTDCA